MKIKLLFVSFVICSQYLWGQQINLVNKTVTDQNCKTLYIGVENELIITNYNSLTIQPQIGVTIKQNKMVVRPTSVGQLTIVFNTNEGQVPLTFDVKRIPDPTLVFGRQSNKQICKESLSTNKMISLKKDSDNLFFENYDVISFTAKYKDRTFDIKGNKLSDEVLSELNSASSGDIFIITSVVAHNNVINKTLELNGSYSYNIK